MILNPHPDYAEMTIKGIKPDLEIGDTLEIGDISYELVQKSSPNDSGYAGYAYRNKSTGDIIVVHEGSEDISNIQNILKNQDEVIKDWIKSDGAFVKNEIPPQFDDAKDFLNEVKSNNSNSNIIQIGQSLGGGLSQLLGMLDNNKNITTYTYNAPGCYRYKDILRQNGYNISANFNNITNYRSKNEPVSGIFKQAGNTYMAINGKSFNHDVRIQTDPSLIYVRNSQSYCYPYGIISSKPYSSGVISSAQPKLFISNFKI